MGSGASSEVPDNGARAAERPTPYSPTPRGGARGWASTTEVGMATTEAQLLDTQRAFDSVAADYDGPTGNNALIQVMRQRLWRAVEATVPRGGAAARPRLRDGARRGLLRGPRLSRRGDRLVAADGRADARAGAGGGLAGPPGRAPGRELTSSSSSMASSSTASTRTSGRSTACRTSGAVARECARLLAPGGRMVLSVIGRRLPVGNA